MYNYAVQERLDRIFSETDARSLSIACDHGLMTDPTFSWMKIQTVVESSLKEKADAILLGPGQIRRFSEILTQNRAPGLIVRTDWVNLLRLETNKAKPNLLLPANTLQYRRLISAREAYYDLGATASIGFLLEDPDGIYESITFKACAELVSESHQIGLPCIVEVIPVNFDQQDIDADELIQRGSWMAAELGADAIKIPYTGHVEPFAKLLESIDIKVLVLGGSSIADEDKFLELMGQVLDLGAHGLIIGRNVSNSPDPGAIIARLRKRVHPDHA